MLNNRPQYPKSRFFFFVESTCLVLIDFVVGEFVAAGASAEDDDAAATVDVDGKGVNTVVAGTTAEFVEASSCAVFSDVGPVNQSMMTNPKATAATMMTVMPTMAPVREG